MDRHEFIQTEKIEMDEDANISSPYSFRGIEYIVTMNSSGGALMVEVEDKLTADQWRASFDAAYIEDLTHKTGNFKQFSIFTSMLESAVIQSSDSVSLDLLTYADLESLRQRKSGNNVKSAIPSARSASLNSKRYLILTYTVEFDRIHYPLPLPYVGKPDPRALQEIIRKHRAEIKLLRQHGTNDHKYKEVDRIQKELKALQKEKESIENEYLQFRRELKGTDTGSAVKEIRMLKTLTKNLEEELMKEKTRHQRNSSKRGQEYRELLEEVEELRASERNLRVRVKSLTNELAMYKRSRTTQRTNRPPIRERSSSYDRYTRDRSNSRERSWTRERSLSNERYSNRHYSRPSSAPINSSRYSDRSPSQRGSYIVPRSRSPSPSAGRGPRFDPTAFIREKERLKSEAKLKRQRQIRADTSGASNRSKPSPRAVRHNSTRLSAMSKGNRNRSRESSVDSLVDYSDGGVSDSSYTGSKPRRRNYRSSRNRENRPQSYNNILSSPETTKEPERKISVANKKKIISSTPESQYNRTKSVRRKEKYPESGDDSDYFDRSTEITEIDERLNRLQQLMKANLP